MTDEPTSRIAKMSGCLGKMQASVAGLETGLREHRTETNQNVEKLHRKINANHIEVLGAIGTIKIRHARQDGRDDVKRWLGTAVLALLSGGAATLILTYLVKLGML